MPAVGVTRRRAAFCSVLGAALLASGLSVAAAAPRQEDPAAEAQPFDMERVAEPQDVLQLDASEPPGGQPVEREVETAEVLGDFSNPPLQGDALAKAELERAADIAAGRIPKDDSFDPETSDKVEASTTPQAEVFDNGNGTRTAVLSAGPQRFKDEGGGWVDYALRPQRSEDGSFQAAASDLDVVVPADPSDSGLVIAKRGQETVVFGLPSTVDSTSSAPSLVADVLSPNGHVVVEDDRGVSAAVTLTTSGFEQQVSFPSRDLLDGDGYELTVELPEGWSVRQGEQGTNRVEFIDAQGGLAATFGSGVAWDASGESLASAQMVDALIKLVGSSGRSATVRVSVSSQWLDDATFPVTIDPTYTYTITTDSTLADTYAQDGITTAQENALFVAGGITSTTSAGTYIKFPLPGAVAGAPTPPTALAGVVSAELKMRVWAYAACNARKLYVQSIASAWTPSTMVWTNRPGAYEPFPTAEATIQNSGCTEAWYSFYPRLSVQNQYDGTIGANGLTIGSWVDAGTDSRRLARSAEYGSNAAQLIVTYEWRPPTPTVVGPADESTVTTTRPALTVNAVTDNDAGDTVKYWFKVWTNPDVEGAGQVINSGWVTTPSWTPPAEYLTNGGTYYWNVVASDTETVPTAPTATRSFSIDTHFGTGNLSDGLGPVGVDLTSGNGVISLDGPGGVSLSYNSTDAPATGLTGYYYQDANSNQTFDDTLKLSRLDSTVNFNWTWKTSPDASLTEDNFLARWEGTVTVPQTGTWEFGTPVDDRARIWVNGTQVLNKWGTADTSPTTAWGTGIALTAGTQYTIKIEAHEGTISGLINLQAKLPSSDYSAGLDVPTSWLLPKERVPQQAPAGWWAAIDGGSPYTSVTATNDVAVVMAGDAAVLEFARDGSGFTPPEGSEATLSVDASGRYMLVDAGTRYVFNVDGTLAMVQSAVDDGVQVPLYEYTSFTSGGKTYPRLASITDPDTGRVVTYTWSGAGTCPVPSGYSTPPVGMICAAVDWDGATTSVLYNSLGRLNGLLADPDPSTSGDESLTAVGYELCGRPTRVRDPLTAATVAAGYRTNDDTTRWQIAYEPSTCNVGDWIWDDKVASVTAPEPVAGAARPKTWWTYNPGQTDTHVAGLTEALGYARRVTYNAEGQLLTDTDATGLETTYYYDSEGRLVSTVDPTGLKTTSIYNARDLLTDEWGPAPSTYWANAADLGPPTSGQQASTPHTTHTYDGNPSWNPTLKSLATSWFNTETGSPDTSTSATAAQRETTLATGVGTTGGEIDKTWTGGTKPPGITDVDNMSGELSGLITFGSAGAYQLKLSRHQRVKVWIDDEQVDALTAWDDGTSDTPAYSLTTTAANEVHRIRIQLANTNDTTATIKLSWDLPTTGTNWVVVPGTSLAPDYGLETSTTDPDGRSTFYSYEDAAKNIGPHHGTAVTTNRSLGGYAFLTDTNIYTDPTTTDLTQTGRQLPTGAASQVTYENYGDTETRDNPCTGAADAVGQAGAPKMRTDGDPDGAGGTAAITYETVYDSHGRTVATHRNSDAWTCTTYDTRGRPVTMAYPAFGGASARTVTYAWTVGGNPLISSVTDLAGTITTMVDLLGRTVEYEDVWGTFTQITYDQAGRESGNTSPAGSFAKTYDDVGRLDTLTLGGNLLADVTYTTGRPTRVDYPSGTGNAGNGTYGIFDYDALGQPNLLKWKQPDATMITHDEITSRSLAGLVLDNKIDNVDPSPSNPSYVYDNAGRLTTARTPGSHTYNYAFATSGGCGIATAAGTNTNRSSKTIDGGTPLTYCYDHADRLTSSSDSAVGTVSYDTHGNATGIFGETHAYDVADRHLSTAKGVTTVSYTRDVTGRIVERKVNGTTSARYGFTGSTDNPSVTLDTSGNVIEALTPLPGGALLTTRVGGNVWSYPNLHGDMVGAADQSGAKQGSTATYDPDGNALSTTINNAVGSADYGWVGRYQRLGEAEVPLEPVIEMGARQYSSRLGRFLEVDPIEGGCSNAYSYVFGNPVGFKDLSGMAPCYGPFLYKWTRVYYWVTLSYGLAHSYLSYPMYSSLRSRVWVSPAYRVSGTFETKDSVTRNYQSKNGRSGEWTKFTFGRIFGGTIRTIEVWWDLAPHYINNSMGWFLYWFVFVIELEVYYWAWLPDKSWCNR